MDCSHDYINLNRLTNRLEKASSALDLHTADATFVNNLFATQKFGKSILARLESSSFDGPSHIHDRSRGSLPDLSTRLDAVGQELSKHHKETPRPVISRQMPPHLEALRPAAPLKPSSQPNALSPETRPPLEPTYQPEVSQQPAALSPREELLNRPPTILRTASAAGEKKSKDSSDKSQQPRDSQDSSHLMQHHREVQEGLTDDLAGMAKQLKLNTLHFASNLEKDKGLMSSVEDRMSGNYDSMQSNRTRLGAYEKKGGWTTWFTILAVAAVCCAWFFMFALIRIT